MPAIFDCIRNKKVLKRLKLPEVIKIYYIFDFNFLKEIDELINLSSSRINMFNYFLK